MKIKMKEDVVGVKGDGGESMHYIKGKEYNMNTATEMAVATAWMSDGRAEQADVKKVTKVVKEMENRGMKGLLSSYGPNGKPKHYNFKTSTMSRQMGVESCEVTTRRLSELKKGSLYYQKYLRHL